MLTSTLFFRRLLFTALPSFALLAGACADNDTIDSPAGGGHAGAGASSAGGGGAGGKAGTAGAAGAGAAGKAGEAGKAGAAGASTDGGAAGEAGSAGSAEAGSAGAAEQADQVAPTVLSTSPPGGAMDVSNQSLVRVTFSEPMDWSTLTSASFRVTLAGNAVPGQISFSQQTATFTPTVPLTLGKVYTVIVTVAATDLAGNALASALTWNFTTSALAALGPAPVDLGAAGNYAVVAKSAIKNVPTSVITGNLALSPAAASYITGFAMTRAGTHWTSPQVVGSLFAADNDPPTPTDLTIAVANMQTAYTDAAGRSSPDFLNLGAGAIGGLTLVPGLYKWASSLTIPTDVALLGAANDVWIFQVTGDLTLSAAKGMTLSGGAQAKNVFWQVAGAVDLGTTSHAEGIVLCKTAITLGTGASINGRLLAQTAVNLAGSTVTEPAH